MIAEDICLIEQACFSEPWTADTVKYQLGSENSVFSLAYEDNVLIGYALGTIAADEAELYRIAVAEKYRRKGYGKRLLEDFLKKCGERGAARVFLEVRSMNAPAAALYERAGFERLSVRKNYYGDDDAVVMDITIKRSV